MTINNLLPLMIVLTTLVTGILIFATDEKANWLRRILNLGGILICLGLIILLITGVYAGETYETRLPLLPDIDLVLHADALSLLFVSLSGLLWLLTTIYAMGYLKGTPNRSRFFGFFSLCVAATLGIALAGNLITFVIFYELLTLATYPLLVHKGNPASLRAGRIYLSYTLIGGALLLAGVVWLKALAGPLDFTATGVLSAMPALEPTQLKIIFALIIAGLGVKAALVPLHGWLPVAMAAPAPVSALLHAVAVVKAGAFGIIRVVYDVYGIEFARDLGLTAGLAGIAAFTIVYGSVIALRQDDIKKRLAYSTVSQVSYIALGTAIAGPIATIGGMVHLVHQGIMKITLFFCAGNLAETLHIHKVSQLNGVGRRMPITMGAFTIGALGMIGIPPVAGFVSKWYLGTGAIEVGAYWVLGILAISSLLNAMYLLPILHAAWFKSPDKAWAAKPGIWETHWMLLMPPPVTAALALAAGLFASATVSPLSWVELIAAREYGREWVQAVHIIAIPLPELWWIVATPLLIAVGLCLPITRRGCTHLAPLAALPALLAGLSLPTVTPAANAVPGLFFGSVLSMNQDTQIMLIFAAALWLIAGIYNRSYLANDKQLNRYTLCFLLCMCGSFGLTLSQDLFGFISFYTLMSFAAYGLVVHTGKPEAIQAGRSYMQWVIIGEVLLFAALVGASISSGSESLITMDRSTQPLWVSYLLVLGFGIKAGLLTMHFWLPRAHPVAPVPASALLSGLMVKAGLIGWWRFLPLGETAILDLGMILMVLGISGAFLAVLAGLIQKNPKALLAYSTISQMGILAAGVGAGLWQPSLWPALSAALLIYAVHHGFAKASLFLSVGLTGHLAPTARTRWLAWLMVLIPAVALAGMPFTSGALAKSALKVGVYELHWMTQILPFTAIGTSLLMIRFIELLWQASHSETAELKTKVKEFSHSGFVAWASLSILVLGGSYFLPTAADFISEITTAKAFWSALWPIVTATLLYLVIGPLLIHIKRRPMRKIKEILHDCHKTLGILLLALLSFYMSYAHSIRHFIGNINSRPNHVGIEQLSLPRVHPGVIFIAILICLCLTLAA